MGCLFAALGVLITITPPFLWLWQTDALPLFWERLSSYVPFYAQLPGDYEFKEGFARTWYLINSYLDFGGFGLLIIASVFGLLLILNYADSIKTKKLAVLLLVLTVLYSLYAAIPGKFWHYHWIPFIYFVSLSAALLFFSPSDKTYQQLPYPKILPALMFISIVILSLPIDQIESLKQKFADVPVIQEHILLNNQDTHIYSHPNANIIITNTKRYLKAHLEPNDKVQPLDWTVGLTQAMLFSKAVLATPYISDFQFYHHVSHDYIQHLRADFMQQLEQTKPKFIVKVQEGAPYKPMMSGVDVSYEFPELVAFIQNYYAASYVGNGFIVFRRNDIDEEHAF